ncbi:hypothetical protein C2845_PM03G34890 [Panicum miliaceum]|uniref:Uncharacterized protein n=1 Tax=Panicum miliaceum TaxID=4540 RepID=A0A3L6T8V7_PANMI|nr:hypothetical protein C2845_PM03G34890 [Panicum miliaceum]
MQFSRHSSATRLNRSSSSSITLARFHSHPRLLPLLLLFDAGRGRHAAVPRRGARMPSLLIPEVSIADRARHPSRAVVIGVTLAHQPAGRGRTCMLARLIPMNGRLRRPGDDGTRRDPGFQPREMEMGIFGLGLYYLRRLRASRSEANKSIRPRPWVTVGRVAARRSLRRQDGGDSLMWRFLTGSSRVSGIFTCCCWIDL